MNMRRVAIVGGGMAGLAAAYELSRQQVPFTLFEASSRLGGIVETERVGGFVMEGGPDGWVTEKPWARELAIELGLETELLPSSDAGRVTYILRDGALHAIPDGMRMMVPTDLEALQASSLFSASAIAAYQSEVERADALRVYAAEHVGEDESVASFVRRHFGDEVARTIAAPLLAGVFGGDVEQLSALSVMPQFVAMERESGSLIAALRHRVVAQTSESIFTTLRSGVGTLVDVIVAALPAESLRLNTKIESLAQTASGWALRAEGAEEQFDVVMLAVPAHVTRSLLASVDAEAALLLQMDASSAVLAGFAFTEEFDVPRGFGLLVPPGTEGCSLLAATFVDQKFAGRVPSGGRSLRAFFGSELAEQLQGESDGYLLALARRQLSEVLKIDLPEPMHSVVRRWPRSLPQYAVGHQDRMRRLEERMALYPSLTLLGNAYRGVGLPDLIRDGRAAARRLAAAR